MDEGRAGGAMTLRRWLRRALSRLRGAPLVLACLAFVACASPPATFTAEGGLEASTRAAVASWERVLPCPIHVAYVSPSEGADVTVEWRVVPDVGTADTLGEGGIKGWEWAEWGNLDSWVYVDPETPPEKLDTVVAHELGHALRADHSPDERDLMYAHYHEGMTAQATDRDGRNVCRAWGYE